MGTTNILPFANGASADVQSDDTYKVNAPAGFVPGPAYPNQANKALRQSSAVAAAVAKLVSDPALGNQATFNDSEDIAALATKLRDAIYALPTNTFNTNMSKLLAYLLNNSSSNPASADKFSITALTNATDTQLKQLALSELYAALLTRKGTIDNPPVSDWTYLINMTDVTAYTGLPGYVKQREYRRLANGMVEVRVGFLEGFKTQSVGSFTIGELPLNLSPAGYCTSVIFGSVSDRTLNAGWENYTYDGDFMLVVAPQFLDGLTNTYKNPNVFVAARKFEHRNYPWFLKQGIRSNPYDQPINSTDPNSLTGTVTSICYMPRLPYPYAYYKGPPAPVPAP